MKNLLSVIVLLLSFCSFATAQDSLRNHTRVTAIVVDGDTVPYILLPQAVITGAMDPEAMKRLQEYYRLRFNVIKMYPYAKLASVKIKEINSQLALLDKRRDKKKYIKQADEQLKKDFEETVKNFSQRQGDV